jgi:putative NIF3 family GTP cyclohydrolase 1 type 2
MTKLTRREFAALTGVGLLAPAALAHAAPKPGATLKAGEIVARIQKNLPPWQTTYRDTFKCGGPASVIKGIASSFGGDLRVLQRAHAQGYNMLIVHEPTFYSDLDVIPWVKGDPVYEWKRNWMEQNNMVVWRTHDNWHARKPDGIQTGWDNAMGWDKYRLPGEMRVAPRVYKLPPTTLKGVATELATKLKTHSIRLIGDPYLPVTLVGRGGHQLQDNVTAPTNVDCIIVSEAREFDSHEYLMDSVLSGERKGVIIISHVTGEDEGMHEMERWLKPIVPELPIKFISTDDALWTV